MCVLVHVRACLYVHLCMDVRARVHMHTCVPPPAQTEEGPEETGAECAVRNGTRRCWHRLAGGGEGEAETVSAEYQADVAASLPSSRC